MKRVLLMAAAAMVVVSAQAQVAMNVPGIELLNDYGQTINGYQTDFTSGFDPADWVNLDKTTWSIDGGVLSIAAAQAHVYYTPSRVYGYQEVLIRARVVPNGNGWNGALVYDFAGTTGLQMFPKLTGDDFSLVWDGKGEWATMGGFARNPAEDWIWMRLGYDVVKQELYASAWLADGLTKEPPQWMYTWEGVYAWHFEDLNGCHAGLVVGGFFEVDYLLIKSASLGEITVGQKIPEPATMTLLALGGLAMLRRRR